MKKLLLLFVMCLSTLSMFAQTPYCCVTKGTVLNYTDYDAKGKETGTTKQTFKEVTMLSDQNYDIAMETTVNVGGNVVTMETSMEVRNGSAMISMGSGSIDVTATDPELLRIPNKLAVGYKLPLGEMYVNLGGMRVKSTITENEVVDREEITTPAGTFKCYVIQQTSSGRVLGMKSETTIKNWYARGIGMVKTESYSKGKLVSSSVLTSIEK